MTRAEAQRSERMATAEDVRQAPRGRHMRYSADDTVRCPASASHPVGRQSPAYAGHGEGMPYATGWFTCETCGLRYHPRERLALEDSCQLFDATPPGTTRPGTTYVSQGIARATYDDAMARSGRMPCGCLSNSTNAHRAGCTR